MTNPRKEETAHERNSLAKDAQFQTKAIAETLKGDEARGYVSLAGGLFLLLISFVYPNLLAWALALVSIGLVVYGARLINLWDKTKNFANYLKARFGKSTKK